MFQRLLDELKGKTAAYQKVQLAALTCQERTEVILDFLLSFTGYAGIPRAEMRVVLNEITPLKVGIPRLDELADALDDAGKYPAAASALGRNARDMALALKASQAELNASSLEGARLRSRRAIAENYEVLRATQ